MIPGEYLQLQVTLLWLLPGPGSQAPTTTTFSNSSEKSWGRLPRKPGHHAPQGYMGPKFSGFSLLGEGGA